MPFTPDRQIWNLTAFSENGQLGSFTSIATSRKSLFTVVSDDRLFVRDLSWFDILRLLLRV